MDYTPISTRRVLAAFAITAFVAFLPGLFMLLQSGHSGPLAGLVDGGYRGLALGAGSIVLTASVTGVLILAGALGRRMVRRPSRA